MEQTLVKIPSSFRIALEASVCQDSLYEFVQMAWPIVQPFTDFKDGWHLQMICRYLEACYYQKLSRLVINVPPRHMKSLLVNVFFPAWVWTKSPEKKFLCTSYAQELTTRDSLLCRTLVTSEWYQAHFPVRLKADQQAKANFENTSTGRRMSTGFGGGMTGEGGDFILIDDPIKMQDADSEVIRKEAIFVMDNIIPTRMNDPKTGAIIMIMQRLNEDDPTGHVLAKGGWEHLVLPAEYDGERFTSSLGEKDPRTEDGQLLWPERFGDKELSELKRDMSSYMVASQLQQRPAPLGGNIFKRDWFTTRYGAMDIVAVYVSADTAGSTDESSANTSIVVGGLTSDRRLIPLLVEADKWEYPQMIDELIRVCELFQDKLHSIIIENKSTGISAIQTLKQTAPAWLRGKVISYNPKMQKPERALPASQWCENGSVILPNPELGGKWLFDFEDELFNFPNGKYKDRVDAFVQLILHLKVYLSQGYHLRIGA